VTRFRFLGCLIFIGLISAFANGSNLLSGQSSAVRPKAAKKASLSAARSSITAPRSVDTYGKLSLSFELNTGQTDRHVRFLARAANQVLFLSDREAVLVFRDPNLRNEDQQLPPSTAIRSKSGQSSTASQRHVNQISQSASPNGFRIQLPGANLTPEVTGLDELAGKSNYLLGNDPKEWRINVPHYAKVRYKSVYPGVDLVYYVNRGQLEYDFVVAPGADPKAIRMRIRGLRDDAKIQVNTHGDLTVRSKTREIRLAKPVVYQPGLEGGSEKAARKFVDVRYSLKGDEVTFEVPSYNRSRSLIIDPAVNYSTFLGGTGYDQGNAITTDSSGNAYIVATRTLSDRLCQRTSPLCRATLRLRGPLP
jgi:hypothetical protein